MRLEKRFDYSNEETMKHCPPPDPAPRTPSRVTLPPGTCDTHAHLFGPESRYPWNPARGYTPPDASAESYEALHARLGVARGVLTQPSVYGTDNACILDYVSRHPDRMRAVVAVGPQVGDAELAAMHARGARGIRINVADKGGNPFASFGEIDEIARRIQPMGWHIEFLLHVHEMDDMIADIRKLPVDMSVGHFGYMPAALGVTHPGFQTFLDLVRDGRTWVKFTAPYRITGQTQTPYDDVSPIARALADSAPDRILWGTDWPHPICPVPMPNDGNLTDHLADWLPDPDLRRRVLVDNPAQLYGFPPVATRPD
jgi:2-pyrone-4,6-dicarboxylate lactonase